MKWISVDDRLPPDDTNGHVLIVFKEPFFGKYYDEISTGYFDDESSTWRFWEPDREVVGPGVTHWMPLPEPPKGNSDE